MVSKDDLVDSITKALEAKGAMRIVCPNRERGCMHCLTDQEIIWHLGNETYRNYTKKYEVFCENGHVNRQKEKLFVSCVANKAVYLLSTQTMRCVQIAWNVIKEMSTRKATGTGIVSPVQRGPVHAGSSLNL